MPLTHSEARRATEIEQIGGRRRLTHVEVEEYYDLATVSHARVRYQSLTTLGKPA